MCIRDSDNITREQMAQILYGYAQLQGQDVSGAAEMCIRDRYKIDKIIMFKKTDFIIGIF